MLKRLVLPLAVPALLLPLVGCTHHHRVVEDEEVVTYRVESEPAPPLRHEVIVERERPYAGAVWINGHWERDTVRHVWVWRHGHWQ